MLSANFIEPGRIVPQFDASHREPGPGEVLIAVKACGICGSDLHMYREDSHRKGLVRTTPEGYDIPGHEFAGVIVGVGEGVTGWAIGDRVVGVTGDGGGMAQYNTVPVNPFQLVRIPDGVSFAEAATTEPLADGLQMITKARIADGETVVIFGVGIIGLGVIQALKTRGVKPKRVIAVDVNDTRLDMARAIGATHAINPRKGDVFDAVAAICGQQEDHRGRTANVDVVIDCAGYIKHIAGPPPLETALNILAGRNGRIICFGAYEGKMLIDFSDMIRKEPVLMGSNGYAAEELVEALQLMADKKVDRRLLISHEFPLEQVSQAFEKQGQPDAVKVMLKIDHDELPASEAA